MRRSMAGRWASMAVCMGALLAVAAMSPRPGAAQEFQFAAIAVSPSTLHSGQAHGGTSPAETESLALRYCQMSGAKDCEIVTSVVNGCAALADAAKPVQNQYGHGTDLTREGAAAKALAECAKGGGIDCVAIAAPCSSDNPHFQSSPLPLPPGGQPGSVDPKLVGYWKLDVSSGIWVWQISANGTYTFHSEAPDNAPSHDGTFTASNGKYTLHAINTPWDDSGTYSLQSPDVMVSVGRLGKGTWYRIAADPGYPEPASGPASRPASEPTIKR